MNSNMLSKSRRQLTIWTVAAVLALTIAFGQGAIGQLLGVNMTPTASACESQGSSGGC